MSANVATKITFSSQLIRAISSVSRELAYELERNASRKLIAEVTLDADRLATFGFPYANEEVKQLIKIHGWSLVLKQATKYV
jgi:hypothetical protein